VYQKLSAYFAKYINIKYYKIMFFDKTIKVIYFTNSIIVDSWFYLLIKHDGFIFNSYY